MSNQGRKILVVSPAWVGDAVMAQTLLQVLKANEPDCIIDILAPKSCMQVYERMPEVNQIHLAPFAHGELKLLERRAIGKKLRSEKYDEAILTPNSFKSALIPFWAKIPKRTGWRGEMRYGLLNDVRILDPIKLPLMIERLMALGIPANQDVKQYQFRPRFHVTKTHAETARQKHNLPSGQKILAFCPGAEFGPAKRWLPQHFAKVADEMATQGWSVWIFGGPKDAPIAANIQQHATVDCIDLTGKTSLADAIDLLSLADVVITNDTGLMHIAAALDRPLVAIYGSSSPKFTPPLADKIKIVSLELDCSPCFQRECPLGHTKCLVELAPSLVLNRIQELCAQPEPA